MELHPIISGISRSEMYHFGQDFSKVTDRIVSYFFYKIKIAKKAHFTVTSSAIIKAAETT